MKNYLKVNEDLFKERPNVIGKMGSTTGSTDELAVRFRSFYRGAYPILFDMIVKEVWLEQHFLYNGRRRLRSQNGHWIDAAFSYFMNAVVGISQRPITTGEVFTIIPTYFKELFPNFTDHDPFEEPEYFKYPYKHVTLDQFLLVHQCHNRMEMLDESEKRNMNSREFINWVTNWITCYSDEHPTPSKKPYYQITKNGRLLYVKRYGK